MLTNTVAFIVFVAAIAFTVKAFRHYEHGHDDGSITPNRWSWLIWGATTIVEALTFQGLTLEADATLMEWSQSFLKASVFYVTAGYCLLIAGKIWHKAKWQMPNRSEIFAVTASIAAIVIWLVFGEAWWAHLIAILAIPVSFIPSWKDAWKDPEQEHTCAWPLWTLGDALTFVGIWLLIDTDKELPYIAMELACHAAMWLLVARNSIRTTISAFRSLEH